MKIGRNTLELSRNWLQYLSSKPETGMGYQICTIVLKNGKKYPQAIIQDGTIEKIRNVEGVPFPEDEIDEIIVTHDKLM